MRKKQTMTTDEGLEYVINTLCPPLEEGVRHTSNERQNWEALHRISVENAAVLFAVLSELAYVLPRAEWNKFWKALKWPVYKFIN